VLLFCWIKQGPAKEKHNSQTTEENKAGEQQEENKAE
jgi:hypothetical protein